MKVSLEPCSRLPRVPWWLAALLVVWIMAVFSGVWLAHQADEDRSMCHVRQLTGVVCPMCGSTRATMKVLTADPIGGFLINPLVIAAGFIFGLVFLIRLLVCRQVIVQMTNREQWLAATVLVALIVANWLYVRQVHGGMPGTN